MVPVTFLDALGANEILFSRFIKKTELKKIIII